MIKKPLYILFAATVTTVLFNACGKDPQKRGLEFMPDMYTSSSYEVYSSNPVFKDSITLQQPVSGTLPRGYEFFHYPNTLEGYEAAGRDVKNPLPASKENLEKGKELYAIYCMHCHGETGQADGALIATGKFPPPPSYTVGKSSRGGDMKDLTDGKMYHTIMYGVNLMGSHASQINPTERWKIIAYVQSIMKGAAVTTDSTITASK